MDTDLDEADEISPLVLRWLENTFLYYEPDHRADRSDFEWEISDSDCYTRRQAERIWRERGGKQYQSYCCNE